MTRCTATISSEEARDQGITHGGKGFTARDVGAPWCERESVTMVPLAFGERVVNAEVCQEHYDEYVRWVDL